MSSLRRGVVVACALTAGCAGVPQRSRDAAAEEHRRPVAEPSQAEWTAARAWITAMRATEATRPFVELVSVQMREPRSGRTLVARGAVAVDPHRAMRMLLVGPGGATALDVWVTPERWRFAVPAIDLLERGARADDGGLPIGFFRWWFLAPLEGRLLTGRVTERERFAVLRAGAATIELLDVSREGRHGVRATRRGPGEHDVLTWFGRGLTPSSGDHAEYVQPRSGLRVAIVVEGLSSDPPDPEAFVDPDRPPALAPLSGSPAGAP